MSITYSNVPLTDEQVKEFGEASKPDYDLRRSDLPYIGGLIGEAWRLALKSPDSTINLADEDTSELERQIEYARDLLCQERWPVLDATSPPKLSSIDDIQVGKKEDVREYTLAFTLSVFDGRSFMLDSSGEVLAALRCRRCSDGFNRGPGIGHRVTITRSRPTATSSWKSQKFPVTFETVCLGNCLQGPLLRLQIDHTPKQKRIAAEEATSAGFFSKLISNERIDEALASGKYGPAEAMFYRQDYQFEAKKISPAELVTKERVNKEKSGYYLESQEQVFTPYKD